jgi:hypothetical protein
MRKDAAARLGCGPRIGPGLLAADPGHFKRDAVERTVRCRAGRDRDDSRAGSLVYFTGDLYFNPQFLPDLKQSSWHSGADGLPAHAACHALKYRVSGVRSEPKNDQQ